MLSCLGGAERTLVGEEGKTRQREMGWVKRICSLFVLSASQMVTTDEAKTRRQIQAVANVTHHTLASLPNTSTQIRTAHTDIDAESAESLANCPVTLEVIVLSW